MEGLLSTGPTRLVIADLNPLLFQEVHLSRALVFEYLEITNSTLPVLRGRADKPGKCFNKEQLYSLSKVVTPTCSCSRIISSRRKVPNYIFLQTGITYIYDPNCLNGV